MSRRPTALIALTASGAAVLAALVVLALRVGAAAPEPDLDPGGLARAAARPPRPSSPALSPPAPIAPSPPGPARVTAPVSQIPLEVVLQAADESGQDPSQRGEGPMAEAIRLYDRGDYGGARARAVQALALEPTDERMLQIAASSSCVLRDAEQARAFHGRLTAKSQRQLARRCRRYGIEL